VADWPEGKEAAVLPTCGHRFGVNEINALTVGSNLWLTNDPPLVGGRLFSGFSGGQNCGMQSFRNATKGGRNEYHLHVDAPADRLRYWTLASRLMREPRPTPSTCYTA
jgi:hypothetical protein